MSFLSTIGGALGGAASSAVGMLFNRKEAEKNRDWQENMSNSAMTRRVEDLRNAGLNPILAAGGPGASTPGGATAAPGRLTEGMASGANTALQYKTVKANVDNVRADTYRKGRTNQLLDDAMQYYGKNEKVQSLMKGAVLAREAGMPATFGALLSGVADTPGHYGTSSAVKFKRAIKGEPTEGKKVKDWHELRFPETTINGKPVKLYREPASQGQRR